MSAAAVGASAGRTAEKHIVLCGTFLGGMYAVPDPGIVRMWQLKNYVVGLASQDENAPEMLRSGRGFELWPYNMAENARGGTKAYGAAELTSVLAVDEDETRYLWAAQSCEC